MNFEVNIAKNPKGKEIISNLMQLYIYELSFFEDETAKFDLLDNGLYPVSKYFNLYWEEEKRFPYILKCGDKIGGFVLVRFNEEGYYEISDFFVLNKYRELGAGSFMAKQMFEMFHGKWEIRTLLNNKRAQDFWRKVITEVSNGNYEEKLIRNNSKRAFYFEN